MIIDRTEEEQVLGPQRCLTNLDATCDECVESVGIFPAPSECTCLCHKEAKLESLNKNKLSKKSTVRDWDGSIVTIKT